MKITTGMHDGIRILWISGAVYTADAGALYDGIVAAVGDGASRMVVDLSGVHIMTRAAVRGLVVGARLAQSARGEMRICCAAGSVRAMLRDLGFNRLLSCDATLADAVAALADGPIRRADTVTLRPVAVQAVTGDFFTDAPVTGAVARTRLRRAS
jgi:anti-anti-sigma factor